MNSEQNSIVEKITKLLRKAENAKEIGSVAEAEAFAEKVQELLVRHKLSHSDLEQNDKSGHIIQALFNPAEFDLKVNKRYCDWQAFLMRVLAEDADCRTFGFRDSNCFLCIGRSIDVYTLFRTFAAIQRLIQQESDKAYWRMYAAAYRAGRRHDPRGFKANWLLGAVEGLNAKLVKRKADMRRAAGEQWGLVLSVRKEVDEAADSMQAVTRNATPPKTRNLAGRLEGIAFGASVGEKKLAAE